MPLTFLLLSLPVSIAAFLMIIAIASLYELFAGEAPRSERRIALPIQRHYRRACVHYVPRRKRQFKLTSGSLLPGRFGQ
jgi:hypothetical protein